MPVIEIPCYTFLEMVLHSFNNCIYFQWDHYFNVEIIIVLDL